MKILDSQFKFQFRTLAIQNKRRWFRADPLLSKNPAPVRAELAAPNRLAEQEWLAQWLAGERVPNPRCAARGYGQDSRTIRTEPGGIHWMLVHQWLDKQLARRDIPNPRSSIKEGRDDSAAVRTERNRSNCRCHDTVCIVMYWCSDWFTCRRVPNPGRAIA